MRRPLKTLHSRNTDADASFGNLMVYSASMYTSLFENDGTRHSEAAFIQNRGVLDGSRHLFKVHDGLGLCCGAKTVFDWIYGWHHIPFLDVTFVMTGIVSCIQSEPAIVSTGDMCCSKCVRRCGIRAPNVL